MYEESIDSSHEQINVKTRLNGGGYEEENIANAKVHGASY